MLTCLFAYSQDAACAMSYMHTTTLCVAMPHSPACALNANHRCGEAPSGRERCLRLGRSLGRPLNWFGDQGHFVALCIELDAVHIRSHQHDASTGGLVEVFWRCRICEHGWIKAIAVVRNRDADLVSGRANGHVDEALGASLLAMLKRIGDGFFKCEANSEAGGFWVAEVSRSFEHRGVERFDFGAVILQRQRLSLGGIVFWSSGSRHHEATHQTHARCIR